MLGAKLRLLQRCGKVVLVSLVLWQGMATVDSTLLWCNNSWTDLDICLHLLLGKSFLHIVCVVFFIFQNSLDIGSQEYCGICLVRASILSSQGVYQLGK